MSTPRRKISLERRRSSFRYAFFGGASPSPIASAKKSNDIGSHPQTPLSFWSPMSIDESHVPGKDMMLFEMDDEFRIQSSTANLFRQPQFLSPDLSRSPNSLSAIMQVKASVEKIQTESMQLTDDQMSTERLGNTARKTLRAKSLFQDTILRGLYLSPNTFVHQDSSPSHTSSTPRELRWSIEEKSLIAPVDIDESKALEQSSNLYTTANEPEIQRVVSQYFKFCNFPSPATPATMRFQRHLDYIREREISQKLDSGVGL